MPLSARRSPSRHSTVVVFPAPLRPSSPKISPRWTSKDTPSTATVLPYRFDNPATLITVSAVPRTVGSVEVPIEVARGAAMSSMWAPVSHVRVPLAHPRGFPGADPAVQRRTSPIGSCARGGRAERMAG